MCIRDSFNIEVWIRPVVPRIYCFLVVTTILRILRSATWWLQPCMQDSGHDWKQLAGNTGLPALAWWSTAHPCVLEGTNIGCDRRECLVHTSFETSPTIRLMGHLAGWLEVFNLANWLSIVAPLRIKKSPHRFVLQSQALAACLHFCHLFCCLKGWMCHTSLIS